jgi:hypothetical protein
MKLISSLQLFNVELANDKRTIFLNNQPFFPKLPTIPTPPQITVPQVRTNFSNRDLSYALECDNLVCRRDLPTKKASCDEWCWYIQLDAIPVDYLYTTKDTKYNGNDTVAEAEYWEFNMKAIGGFAGRLKEPEWGFDKRNQKMLKVVVEGTALEIEKPKKGQDSLFSPPSEEEKTYDYRIVDVKLVDREYNFPARKPLSFHQKISRFFGNDVWDGKGQLVYIREEWDVYGKVGTLRNFFGYFINWQFWDLVAIIVPSVLAGLLALYGFYRLFFWIQEQRELMKWDGMEDVWDKLRREREEEESALLDGRYRDEPEEGGSPRPPQYTDTMKPLPAKPLPDKPLPDVPLIDA